MSLPRNLDQEITTALVLWFQQNTVISNLITPVMMFDYWREDVPVSADTWLLVYPEDADEGAPVMYHYGWLKIDIVFTTKWVREQKTIQAIKVAGTILSQIKQSANADLIVFMNQYIGGLQNLGLINKVDYKPLYKTTAEATTCKIQISFKYRINWLLYQTWLETYGCDIKSPEIPIYVPLEDMHYNQTIPIHD